MNWRSRRPILPARSEISASPLPARSDSFSPLPARSSGFTSPLSAGLDGFTRPLPTQERITVPLIEKAAEDLRITHDRTGLSRTDIVNRAISLYEFIDAELRAHTELIVRRNGKDHVIKLL
jgi:hypothetical protein